MSVSPRTCAVCGSPLPARPAGPGRASRYCSAACRQRAYRERATPPEQPVDQVIADIARRAQALAPAPVEALAADADELGSRVARLRRMARTAADAARQIVTAPAVTENHEAPDGLGELDFAELTETHRRELRAHCYRLLGSYDEAEDLVQETFLRAWRARDGFAGRATARTWLFRVATNACLDHLRALDRRPRRYQPLPGMDHGSEQPPESLPWLQPYPDAELPDAESPEAAAESRETIELVFLTALQHLPPRQRAVLVLRDVLGQPAAEAAEALDLTVASANSALQRARATLREHLPARREDWPVRSAADAAEQQVLDRYMAAARTADLDTMARMLADEVVLTMPPNPFWFVGRDALLRFVGASLDPASPVWLGEWRHLPTRANGRPALAGYVRRPGTTVFRAQVLDVLRIGADGRIAEITSFEPHLFAAFGLPPTLSGVGATDDSRPGPTSA